MTARILRTPATIMMALSLGGCAGSVASYPSLAPRPIERASVAAPAGDGGGAVLDPTVAARAAELVAQARRGGDALDLAERSGCAAIAGGARAREGSEAWIAAQQAFSAIEAARTPTASALIEMDALMLEQARLAQDAATPSDLSALIDAAGEVAALDEAQRARLASLRAEGCAR